MCPTVRHCGKRLLVLHLPSLLDIFSEVKLVSQLSSATHRRLAHTHSHTHAHTGVTDALHPSNSSRNTCSTPSLGRCKRDWLRREGDADSDVGGDVDAAADVGRLVESVFMALASVMNTPRRHFSSSHSRVAPVAAAVAVASCGLRQVGEGNKTKIEQQQEAQLGRGVANEKEI